MYIRAQCGAQNVLSIRETRTITKIVVTSKSRAGSLIGGILGYMDLLVLFCCTSQGCPTNVISLALGIGPPYMPDIRLPSGAAEI